MMLLLGFEIDLQKNVALVEELMLYKNTTFMISDNFVRLFSSKREVERKGILIEVLEVAVIFTRTVSEKFFKMFGKIYLQEKFADWVDRRVLP